MQKQSLLVQVRLSSESGVNIIVANSDNDFLSAATDVNGTAITTGFGNGTFDLDGLLTATTPGAVANQALDTSDSARAAGTGKSLIGEVVNSRVVITQLATITTLLRRKTFSYWYKFKWWIQ